MKLYLTGHDYRYGVEQMMMTLFPGQRPEYPEGEPEGDFPAAAVAQEQAGDTIAAHARLWWEGKVYQGEERLLLTDDPGPLGPVRAGQRAVNIAFYRAGVAALGAEPPWGALTGVRPVKLPTRRRLEGGSRAEALAELIKDYRVSPERAELAMECADAALWVQAGLGADSLSLYISIPFCPTRCAYCSFISADVQRTLKLVEPYVDALCREIGSVNPDSRLARLEEEWLTDVNELGIGVQGFGGPNTAIGLFIEEQPCHFASLPVAVNLNCHCDRSRKVVL